MGQKVARPYDFGVVSLYIMTLYKSVGGGFGAL